MTKFEVRRTSNHWQYQIRRKGAGDGGWRLLNSAKIRMFKVFPEFAAKYRDAFNRVIAGETVTVKGEFNAERVLTVEAIP